MLQRLIVICAILLTGCTEEAGDAGSGMETGIATTPSQAIDREAEIEALRAADQEALRAFRAGDASAFDALYAEDAVLVNPSQEPLEGRAAIDSLHRAEMTTTDDAAWEPIRVDVSESGDLGYVYGRWSSRSTDPEGGAEDQGYYVNVYQKIDGQWKTIVEVNGSSTPRLSSP